MSGNAEIWSINADSSEQRQLTNDPADDATPASSPDSRFIFFVSNRTGEAQVWRMNADGSKQTQITFKEGGTPIFVSPDGRWVYYQHALQATLWRASTEGGDEQIVLNKERIIFAFSPDGARVAFSERRVGETSIVIVSLADGRIVKTFTHADKFAVRGEGLRIGWLPDGNSLVYAATYHSTLDPCAARPPVAGTSLTCNRASGAFLDPPSELPFRRLMYTYVVVCFPSPQIVPLDYSRLTGRSAR